MSGLPFISVVIPVKDEGALLRRCLASLRGLAYPAERMEVIIADGRSKDDTREVALEFSAKVVDNEGEVVVTARNRGFAASQGELVAFTDADCVFDRMWLTNCVAYFDDPAVAGVGGKTLPPQESTDFERAVNRLFSLAEAFGSTSHRQKGAGARQVRDIPGCNAIYRRSALSQVMPVYEGLLTAEDVWMNRQLTGKGFILRYAPDVLLWHYRRNSPARLLRQAYRFAVGRLQAARKDKGLLSPLHLLAGLGIPLTILAAAVLYSLGLGRVLLWCAALLAAFSWASVAFLRGRLAAPGNLAAAGGIFFFGWSAGFLRELFLPMKEVRGK